MNVQQGFAVWLTGLPASGKSSITRELERKLAAKRIYCVVLESDEMRRILTPRPNYGPKERDAFYRALALIGELITRSGTHVIFDATANRQAYRDFARARIPKFMEVFVRCPLDICLKRDPKRIYSRASAGDADAVPGVQVPYESPVSPEVVLDCEASPETGVDEIIHKLKQLLYI